MRIVFVTPHPPSRVHARSLGFIVALAQRHLVTTIALCRTARDAAALHRLRALGVETIAVRDRPSSAEPTEDATEDATEDVGLAQARVALTRVVARGDVGIIQIEGTRLGTVADGLWPPVMWDVVGEAELARQRLHLVGASEQARASRPETGATQPVRVVAPRGPRRAQSQRDDADPSPLGQYASVIVGSERDAITALGARRSPAAPLSARLTEPGVFMVGQESGAQEDDLALRSFPLLRRQRPQPDENERPTTPVPLPFPTQAPPAHGLGVTVIPEAIDLAYYTPQAQEHGRVGVVISGDLADDATIQGIVWLLSEVAPRIWRISPQINLTIVGRGDSALPVGAFADVQEQLRDERVRLVEGMEDTRALIRQAALVIIPALDLAGVPTRRTHECALEAMALGTPVVVTQAALSGLMAVPGRDLLVATSAERLATLTLRVLGDDDLWGMLARHGRAYVARRHSWRLASQQLERLYARALGYPPGGAFDQEADADAAAERDALSVRPATVMGARAANEAGAGAEAISVMSLLGLVGLATHPLAGAPSSGRLAPRWR